MTSITGSPGPAPMEGQGAYNRSSQVQAAGSSPALPLFEQAARIVPLAGAPEAIVVADYGSSQGRNSLAPMALAIRALRDRIGPERAISVVHTDLPSSDFSTLFQTLDNDSDSYLGRDDATFAAAVGRSFYQQILPSSSVTLGWSSWAIQWLSRAPAPIPDHIQVAYSRDLDARAAYARQAAEDWRTFLAHRSRELRPGGRLVVLTMAAADDCDFGYRPVIEALHGTLIGLVGEGFIGSDEVGRMVIPTVSRSRADLVAPFAEAGRFGDLTVEHADVFLGDDLIWETFERDRDAGAFAARWAGFARAAVFPTLALGLDPGRDDRYIPAFFDRMEAGMVARLAAAPQRSVLPLARFVCAKEPG